MIDYGGVEDARQAVLATYAALEERLDYLERFLAALDSQWAGAASDAFREKYAQWQVAARQVHSDLAFVHRLVCTAQSNFAAADTAVLATWQAGR